MNFVTPPLIEAENRTISLESIMVEYLNCTDHEACFTGVDDTAIGLYCNATYYQGFSDSCCDTEKYIGVDETDQWLLNKIMNVYLMGLFGMVGVFSNILSAIVLHHPRISGTTTSHYLLFLAISDFTLCFFVTLFCMTEFGEIMPENVMTLYIRVIPYLLILPQISRLNSVLLVVAVTIERYIVVCHPLKAAHLCTLRSCRFLIGTIFLVAVVFNLPRLFFLEYAVCFGVASTFMTDFFLSPSTKIVYSVVFEALFYCICPFAILIVFNILLLRSVRRSTNFIRTSKSAYERRSEDNQRQLTVMLVVVIAAFVTGQVPAFIHDIVVRPLLLHDPQMKNNDVVIVLGQIRNFPVLLNSALNFWIYCAAGKKFREALLIMFCGRFDPSLRALSTECRSNFSNNLNISSNNRSRTAANSLQHQRLRKINSTPIKNNNVNINKNNYVKSRTPSPLLLNNSNNSDNKVIKNDGEETGYRLPSRGHINSDQTNKNSLNHSNSLSENAVDHRH